MHPPFYIPDPLVGPHAPHHVRRTRPERLRLTPAAPGWPPLPLGRVTAAPPPAVPAPVRPVPRPVLQVVPPPQPGLRDLIGRFLIRTGQRMLFRHSPGC